MKKKIWFILLLLVGLLIIVPSLVVFSFEDRIIDVVAIYISVLTAVFAIFVESSSIKDEKQKIYGQLKKTMLTLISGLKKRNYEYLDFSIWKSIQQDDRHQLVDKEIREKLDTFLDKTITYSDTISKLDWHIIPEIIHEAVLTVFNVNRTSHGEIRINIQINLKDKLPFQTFISKLNYYLKRQQSLVSIINHKAKANGIEEEIESYQMYIQISPSDITDNDKITKFWNMCLDKIESVPELKFVIEENDSLLEEAKEIKKELIKQIEKTIES